MIRYFARHPTAANLLMLVFILLGVLALPQLQRETYPEFEASRIRVRASYAGADAEVIDETIVTRIEGAISGVEGVDTMTSRAREGSASVTLEIADGYEPEVVLAEVKAAVDAVKDLPEGMEDAPTTSLMSRTAQVASVAVTGPMSGQELKRYCERVRRALLTDPEISLVSLAGFSTHQLKVKLDRSAMARFGVGVSEVATAIRAQSLDSPLGSLKMDDGELLVRYSDKRVTPEQLASIVLKSGTAGGEVRLEAIANIEDTFSVESDQTYFNGARAGTLNISKTSSQDSLEVLAAVKRVLAEEEQRKPEGVQLAISNDVTSVIGERLELLVVNGIQGLILVFIVLGLFFNIRLAFWVAAGLPVSFLGAVFVMNYTGQTLNMMSMMGLLVAIGLLMDDAIVLAENVATHRQRGKSPVQASIDGIREVAGGVLSSFVTTICVFVPLTAIDGRIGRTLQVIPAILVAVLAVSLVEAFLILPNHLGHIPPTSTRPNRFRQGFDRVFSAIRENIVGRVVDLAIRFRYATLGLTVASLIVAAGLVTSGTLRYQAFPDTEGDVVEYRLALPPGTSLEQTKEEVERIVQAAQEVATSNPQPGGDSLVRSTSARFNYNSDFEETGPHLATVSVDLLSVETRSTTLADFSTQWRKAIGPVNRSAVTKIGGGGRRGPGGNPIEIRLQGDDLVRLKEVAGFVQKWFEEIEGTTDLTDDLQPGAAQIKIQLRPGVRATGLTPQTLAQQIQSTLSGVSVENLFVNGEEFEVFVELEQSGRDTVTDLEHLMIPVTDAEGNATVTPLAAVASIERSRSYAAINRIGGVRTVSVTGGVDREVINVSALMRRFMEERLPELEQEFGDVRFAVGGEIEQSAETVGSMERGMVIGLFAIFVLLSLQFRNYLEPIVVMLAIPFAFVGVVFGNLAIGAPLSSQAVLGFVSLAGVVVNDSILLMVFIREARATGSSALDAAKIASRGRFRAVLLTSVTTIFGLVPLMFETSRQAQSLIPVATSIVFGISASTVLVLIVLPATYAVLGDLQLVRKPDC